MNVCHFLGRTHQRQDNISPTIIAGGGMKLNPHGLETVVWPWYSWRKNSWSAGLPCQSTSNPDFLISEVPQTPATWSAKYLQPRLPDQRSTSNPGYLISEVPQTQATWSAKYLKPRLPDQRSTSNPGYLISEVPQTPTSWSAKYLKPRLPDQLSTSNPSYLIS
jgi:hypothetical protein